MSRSPKEIAVALFVVVLAGIGLLAEEAAKMESCPTALVAVNLDTISIGSAGTGAPYPEDWRTVDDRHVMEASADVIAAARGAGLLIVYLYGDYEYPKEGDKVGTFGEEITPEDGDILIGRPGSTLNPFRNTSLLETLRSRGVRNLIVTGVHTGYCVDRFSRIALTCDFDVTVVADAHSGGPPHFAQRYNDYWKSLGMDVVATAELDFAAFGGGGARASMHSGNPVMVRPTLCSPHQASLMIVACFFCALLFSVEANTRSAALLAKAAS